MISITGGRDLTLFEVDEAATRIREEIDGDANIILGATFDESLEGIVRVSVVATGIDSSQQQKQMAPTQSANTEAVTRSAPKPQPESVPSFAPAQAISAKPVDRPATVKPAVEATAPAKTVGEVSIQPFKPDTKLEPKQLEDAFQSALEDEISSDDGFVVPVSMEPAPPKAAAPIPTAPAEPQRAPAKPAAPAVRTPQDDTSGAKGLLSKLKNSFGTKEADEPVVRQAPAAPVAAPMPRPVAEERPQPMPRQADPFAPKRAPLDDNGRIMRPEAPQSEDDQLEIPAFLRRQAN